MERPIDSHLFGNQVSNTGPSWPSCFPCVSILENFKKLLIRNDWTDFNITLQKFSFGKTLSRLFMPSQFVLKIAARV